MQMRQQDKWVQAALGALEWMREERSVSLVIASPSHLGAVITTPSGSAHPSLKAMPGLWLDSDCLRQQQELNKPTSSSLRKNLQSPVLQAALMTLTMLDSIACDRLPTLCMLTCTRSAEHVLLMQTGLPA